MDANNATVENNETDLNAEVMRRYEITKIRSINMMILFLQKLTKIAAMDDIINHKKISEHDRKQYVTVRVMEVQDIKLLPFNWEKWLKILKPDLIKKVVGGKPFYKKVLDLLEAEAKEGRFLDVEIHIMEAMIKAYSDNNDPFFMKPYQND